MVTPRPSAVWRCRRSDGGSALSGSGSVASAHGAAQCNVTCAFDVEATHAAIDGGGASALGAEGSTLKAVDDDEDADDDVLVW